MFYGNTWKGATLKQWALIYGKFKEPFTNQLHANDLYERWMLYYHSLPPEEPAIMGPWGKDQRPQDFASAAQLFHLLKNEADQITAGRR